VLEAAEALDLVPIIADALVTRGSALGVLGRSHESLALLAAGRDLAAANGQVDIRLRAVNNLSTMIFTGSPREALAMLRDGLADARRLGMRGWVAGLGGNAVECALYAGEWDWATAEAEAILAIEPDAEDRLQILQALIAVRAFRGQPLDQELTDAERLWSAMPTWFGTAMRHNIGAYVAFAAGDFALARRKAGEWIGIDSLNAPIATATATRAALWEGDAAGVATGVSALAAMGSRGDGTDLRRRTLAAGLAAVEGRTREALREYLDVLAQWEACGAPWERALATVDMATVLDTDDPSVAEAVARGREILVGLGAAPFIERLDAAVGRLPARPRVTVSPATSAGEALVAGRDGSSTPAR
jgi:hypothetical protein